MTILYIPCLSNDSYVHVHTYIHMILVLIMEGQIIKTAQGRI